MLSVIIPCFNDGVFLTEAIDSVFRQGGDSELVLPDLEVLVVDDQSTDLATLELLQRLPDRWPKVRVIRNTRSKGLSGARNAGIEAARGEWVAFLDADDVWLPDALACRWRFIIECPSATWLAGDFAYWYPDGTIKPSGNDDVTTNPRSRILAKAYVSKQPLRLIRPVKEFIEVCLILVCGAMVKRELFDVVGGFDESLSPAEDYEMWLRLARIADLHFVPQPVFLYRQRQGSITDRRGPPANFEILLFSRLMARGDVREYAEDIREKLASLNLANCYYYRKTHQRRKAVLAAARMVCWQPLGAKGWGQLIASISAL